MQRGGKWGKREQKVEKGMSCQRQIAWHHMWKVVHVQIEDRKWMVVAMRQRARSRKEQQCSESDGKGDEGGAKEKSDDTKHRNKTNEKHTEMKSIIP